MVVLSPQPRANQLNASRSLILSPTHTHTHNTEGRPVTGGYSTNTSLCCSPPAHDLLAFTRPPSVVRAVTFHILAQGLDKRPQTKTARSHWFKGD